MRSTVPADHPGEFTIEKLDDRKGLVMRHMKHMAGCLLMIWMVATMSRDHGAHDAHGKAAEGDGAAPEHAHH